MFLFLKYSSIVLTVLFMAACTPSLCLASEGPLWAYVVFGTIAKLYSISHWILSALVIFFGILYLKKRKRAHAFACIVSLLVLSVILGLKAFSYQRHQAELKRREMLSVTNPEAARINQMAAEDLMRFSAQLKARLSPAGNDMKVKSSPQSMHHSIERDNINISALSERVIRDRFGSRSFSTMPPEELHNIGLDLFQNRKFLGAIAAWLYELDKRPSNSIILNHIGLAFIHAGDIQRGINYATKACESDPGYGRAFHTLALGYLQNGEFKKALAVLNAAEAGGWTRDDLYHTRGVIYEFLNKPLSAQGEFRKMKTKRDSMNVMTAVIDESGDPHTKQAPLRYGLAGLATFRLEIDYNSLVPLQQMDKHQIFDLRKSKVSGYRELKIYPENYAPEPSIFEQLKEYVDWVRDTQFFIVNPYLLIIDSAGEYVDGLIPFCPVTTITYSQNKITARYEKEAATKWFYYIYEYYPDSKGVVRLWFVNALDAGFRYFHVDAACSANIEPIPNSANDHVMKSVYAPREFFHVGRYKKNNISPNDNRAKLKLKDKNVRTVIYIKLWANRPDAINSKEDFSYVIEVDPGKIN